MSTDAATVTDHAAVRAMPLGEALDGAPMSRFHVRFWLLAGLGILLDGFDFFIIGVANPLVAKDFTVGSALQGLALGGQREGGGVGAQVHEGLEQGEPDHDHDHRAEQDPGGLQTERAHQPPVFPSEMRAAGHGFATGCGKLGAALGTFLFPVLLARLGESLLLYGVAVTSALGFPVTYLCRIEPRGRSLQELSGLDAAALAPRIPPP
ncbi:MFS transporter [Streptomyces mirabilis]|uniref:MFS transporter n=1 Tax=Streptomyces mirabilis TaxID=68239 RepID=UPI00362D1EC4